MLQMEKQTPEMRWWKAKYFGSFCASIFFFGFDLAAKLPDEFFAEIGVMLAGQLWSCQHSCLRLLLPGQAASHGCAWRLQSQRCCLVTLRRACPSPSERCPQPGEAAAVDECRDAVISAPRVLML